MSMTTKDFQIMTEAIAKNSLNEATTTSDIAGFGALITPLIEKIYPETLVSQIADVQPLNGPVGKIAALFCEYTGSYDQFSSNVDAVGPGIGDNKDNFHQSDFYESSRVIALDYANMDPFVVDPSYTLTNGSYSVSAGSTLVLRGSGSASATCKVLYAETVSGIKSLSLSASHPTSFQVSGADAVYAVDGPYKEIFKTVNVLVVSDWTEADLNNPIVAGAASATVGLAGASGSPRVVSLIKNRTALKKMFFKYSGTYPDDTNNNVNRITLMSRAITVEVKARKLASTVTVERIQDLQARYGANYIDKLAKIIGSEIKSDIDKEVIDYLKLIAKPMKDINMVYSLGVNASTMLDMSSDLVTNINIAVEDIVKLTKRNRTMFVLADSATIGYLKINPWHVKVDPQNNNPYRVGTIGPYPLFCDPYSTENYIIVGYIYDSDEQGDAGLIFSPYSHQIVEVDDGIAPGRKNIVAISRYAYTRHPQDTGQTVGDSDFFRYFRVDFTGHSPLTPAANVFDIPNLTKNLLQTL